jgi:hypothetical protein
MRIRMSGLFCMLAAIALGGAATTAAAQDCTGDCEGDDAVTLQEIRTCTDFALSGGTPGACPACDRGDGRVSIDDLVAAVIDHLGDCSPDAEAGKTGASASQQTSDNLPPAIGIFDIGYLSAGGGGSLAGGAGEPLRLLPLALLLPASSSEGGAASTFVECPGGGAASVMCTLEGDLYRVDALYIECTVSDPQTGNQLTYDGDQTITSADAGLCMAGEISDKVPVTTHSTSLTFTARSPSGPAFQTQQVANATQTLRRDGPGCSFTNGAMEAHGDFSVQCRGRLIGSRLQCDPETIESFQLRFDDFVLQIAPQSQPDGCLDEMVASGGLTAPEDDFAAVYDEFLQTFRRRGALEEITQRGSLTVPCLGLTLFLQTREPLVIPATGECPAGGLLEVSSPNAKILARYSPNGIAFDFDDDGRIDETVPSCDSRDLAACFNRSPPPTPTVGPPSGLVCSRCATDPDCDSRLVCLSCLNCATGAVRACGPDDLVIRCGQSIFGPTSSFQ